MNLKEDISTAFCLALVVLPLSLGIAIASGVPPMAGVIAAVVGGLVTTFLRGSHLAINGPSAGLIAVVFAGVHVLGEGDAALGFSYVLAATIIAGILQMLLGVLRLGELGDMVPAASIHGMLAAVGIIIFSTQIHVALGVDVQSDTAWQSLEQIPTSLQNFNPFITLIALISLVVLVLHHRTKNNFVAMIPPPVWILLFTIPVVYWFNFFEAHEISFMGHLYPVGPEYLISLPDSFQHSFSSPNFTKINTLAFWGVVMSILAISSIETVVSAKAVDKLDSLNRQTNLNKELFAVGLSTSISGMIGGLPIITAIPVYNGAKSKWANWYYGVFLLFFILIGTNFIQQTPLAALAVLLVYTGYKLASPKVLIETYRKGDDQFLILLCTLIAALTQGLLIGIFIGILTTLFTHFVKSNLEFKQFLKYLTEPSISTNRAGNSQELHIHLKGVVNFINIPKLKKILRMATGEKYIVLDMSNARLIDYTVLEYLHEDVERYDNQHTTLEIIGLETHDASSRHPNATRILREDKKPQLNKRQQALEALTLQYQGSFWPEMRWELNHLKNFTFFKTRNILYSINTAKGNYKMFLEWETCDLTFEEGGLFSKECHTSIALLHLPFNAPLFVLQQEEIVDKIGVKLHIQEQDINFDNFPNFSKKFLLQGSDKEGIKTFFTPKLIQFLQQNPYFHIESNGSSLLIFKEMHFASPSGMAYIHEFSEQLAGVLLENWKTQPIDLESLMLV